jgi:hypothetical protein
VGTRHRSEAPIEEKTPTARSLAKARTDALFKREHLWPSSKSGHHRGRRRSCHPGFLSEFQDDSGTHSPVIDLRVAQREPQNGEVLKGVEVAKVPSHPDMITDESNQPWRITEEAGLVRTLGGFIHILLIVAIIAVLIRVIQGRNPLRG